VSVVPSVLFSVMLLLDPSEVVDRESAAAISEDADRVELQGEQPEEKREKTAVITSRTSDYDRESGVVLFEGHVVVEYDTDYVMCADRIFAFLTASNQLSRVVAVGNVAITNELRVGTAPMATFRRRKSEIEMFGDKTGAKARLVDGGEGNSAVEGTRIRFWLDTERVEVEDSVIQSEHQEGNGGLMP